MRLPNYSVESVSEYSVVLVDEGPWDVYPTITNAAEEVCAEIHQLHPGKRIFYRDSDNYLSELVHDKGVFIRYDNF